VPDFTLPAYLAFLSTEWKSCVENFLRDIYERSHSIKSVRSYRAMLFAYLIHHKKSPEQCTRAEVLSFLRSPCKSPGARGRPPAIATSNARLCVLASFYQFASLHFEQVVPNPTLNIKPTKRQRPEKKRGMSDEELARFLAAIPQDTVRGSRDYALFALYLWTGRRRAEIARLRYSDIEACVFVEDGVARDGWRFRYYGKGHSQEAAYQELPKGAKAALDRYLEKSGRIATIGPDDPLFIAYGSYPGGGRRSDTPNAPLHVDTVRDNFKRYLQKAGLDTKRLSVHSLRHTAAQQHWRVKPDLFLLQHYMGHASPLTTQCYVRDLFGESDPVSQLLESRYAALGLQ
jgi:integrase/recombinase XerD